MSMQYGVQRYALTRPWAKRVGQLFSQPGSATLAEDAVGELVGRELARVAQVYGEADGVPEAERVLALAYGCHVRHGRLIAEFDAGLARALAHTRLPSHLPDTLILPAEAFFLQVSGEASGGAFIRHRPADRQLDLVLVEAAFSGQGTNWWQVPEPLWALTVSYPGELAPQLDGVPAPWRPLLESVLNGFAMMTQPKVTLEAEWEEGSTAEWVAAATHPTCPKTRQKGRRALLKAGFIEVTRCQVPELPGLDGVVNSAGYWRRQALGDDKSRSRLVWVAPR